MKSFSSALCSFCGKKHSTEFSGGERHGCLGGTETIYCCSACAVRILPALIADSIHLGGNHYTGAQNALVSIEAAFWKGIAARTSSAVADLACKLAALAEKQARSERGVK